MSHQHESHQHDDEPAPAVQISARQRLQRRALAPVSRAAAAGRIATARALGAAGTVYDVLPAHRWEGEPITTGRPIVLIGGYASSPAFYRLLARSYLAAGVQAVHVVPLLDNAYADIRENTRRLAQLIDGLGCDIDLVGHSEGGLIARAYVKFHEGAARVPHLVTLGSPNQGIDFDHLDPARLVDHRAVRVASEFARRRLGPLVEELSSVALTQMRTGSEFMIALNAPPASPGPTQYLALASRHDGLVPFHRATLPAAPNVANVSLEDGWVLGNHAAIATTSRRAFDLTLQFLQR